MEDQSIPLINKESSLQKRGNEGSGHVVNKTTPNEENITYSWKNVCVSLDGHSQGRLFKRRPFSFRKEIIKDACGVAFPGELLAIIGASGSGKTTLLDALTFNTRKGLSMSGSNLINGNPINISSFTNKTAYVQQTDLFLGSLTIREHLIFQALLKIASNYSYKQKIERVDHVINELLLSGCKDRQIGKKGGGQRISGGERKRLAFAAEILTDPMLMFCDEPTSGLDSFMASNILQWLKKFACAGKTVICTLHQPSSQLYSMFDKILLMAEGRVVFLGTPKEAEGFFADINLQCPINYNPTDHFMRCLAILPGNEIACVEKIDKICRAFEKSKLADQVVVGDIWVFEKATPQLETHPTAYKVSFFEQFRALLWRSWLCEIREPLLYKIRLLQAIGLSLFLGFMYFQQPYTENGAMNTNGAIFMMLNEMSYRTMFTAANLGFSELPLFFRENKNGMYRTDAYFLSKLLVDLATYFTLIPICFAVIAFPLIEIQQDLYKLLISVGILVLISHVITGCSYIISYLATNYGTCSALVSLTVMPLHQLGGFYMNVGSFPPYIEWLSYLSWFRYGFEALLVNQWNGVDITCLESQPVCPKNGTLVLESLDFSNNNFIFDIYGLLTLFAVFRTVAFIILLIKAYKY